MSRTGGEPTMKRRKEEEYQMQVFGLHSRTVSAAIEQKIKENVDHRCHKIYSSMMDKYNPEGEVKSLLKSNIRNLRETYHSNVQAHLAAIENIVHKFVSVPSNVLLENDKCQAVQYNTEEFYNLESNLENLQQQARRVTIFNAALKEELETIENMQESIEVTKKLCDTIENGLNAKKVNSKTLKAVEKNRQLKSSLDSIKPETEKDVYNPRLKKNELHDLSL